MKKISKKKEQELIRKLIWNKKNNQISLTLPRKKLKLKGKNPKKIKLKILGFE